MNGLCEEPEGFGSQVKYLKDLLNTKQKQIDISECLDMNFKNKFTLSFKIIVT